MTAVDRQIRTSPVLLFFLLTFLFSWSVWLWAAHLAAGAGGWWSAAVHMAGLCGPTIAAAIMSGLLYGGSGVGALLKRIAAWRVGVGWYLFANLSALGLGGAAIGLHALMGGATPPLSQPLVPLQAVGAGLWEEYGWRGFALPHLSRRYGALRASLIIAFVWVLWHLPIAPALKSPVVFIMFLVEVAPLSILFTWLYANTGGSILLAVLYHQACNAVVNALNIPASPSLWAVYVALLWLCALLAVVRFGGPRLNGRRGWTAPSSLEEPSP